MSSAEGSESAESHAVDLLVRWKKDGTMHIVDPGDLWFSKRKPLRKGTSVKMRDERGRWWAGKVQQVINRDTPVPNEDTMDNSSPPVCISDIMADGDSDSEDDLSLTQLVSHHLSATAATPTASTPQTGDTSATQPSGTSATTTTSPPQTSGTSATLIASTPHTSGSSATPIASTFQTSGTSATTTTSPLQTNGTSATPTASTPLTSGTSATPTASTPLTSGTSATPTASTPLTSGTSATPTASTPLTSGTSATPTASTPLTSGTSATPVTATPETSGTSATPTASTPQTSGTSATPTASPPQTSGISSGTPTASPPQTSGTSATPTTSPPQTSGISATPTIIPAGLRENDQHKACMHNCCKEEIFASCVVCYSLLCFRHFIENDPCEDHIELLNDPSLAQIVQEIQFEVVLPNEDHMDAGTTAAGSDGVNIASSLTSTDDTSTIPHDVTSGHDDMDETNRQGADDVCPRNDPSLAQIAEEVILPNEGDEDHMDAGTTAAGSDGEDIASSLTSTDDTSSIPRHVPSGHDDMDETTCDSSDGVCPRRPRKRNATPDNWKRNVKKRLRNTGEAYKSFSGKEIPARVPGPSCSSCKFKCSNLFSTEVRKELCRSYWKTGNYNRQRDFIRKHVDDVKERKPHKKGKKTKSATRRKVKYFLPCESNTHQVCREFFLSTLAIGEKLVRYTCSGSTSTAFSKADGRGKRTPYNKTPDELLNGVRTHIESFPKVESHYCRKSSKRQYLSPLLSVNKMYDLYKADNPSHVSLHVYRTVFNTEFNLGFHTPKKDSCKECESFKNKTSSEKDEDCMKEHMQHLENKDMCRKVKSESKEQAQKDASYRSYSFDLQQVLPTPSGTASTLFYKRKLSSYNLTVHDQASGDATCYVWHEYEGKRGGAEIGSCLLKTLQNLPADVADVSNVSFFSDGCGGQNRNRITSTALMYAVLTIPKLASIDHTYLECGHTQMECDMVHSCIEHMKKGSTITHPDEWLGLIKGSRRKHPFSVVHLGHEDFFNIAALSSQWFRCTMKDDKDMPVKWMKIRQFRYEKSSANSVKFRYDFHEEFREMRLAGSRRRLTDMQLQRLYPSQLCISSAKKNDLVELCHTFVIPSVYHPFYKNLPSQVMEGEIPNEE